MPISGTRLCGAWARQPQRECRQPAMRGRARCRLHGGKSFGPPKGSRNGLTHGAYTPEARETRKQLKTAIAASVAQAEALTAPPKRPRGRPQKVKPDAPR